MPTLRAQGAANLTRVDVDPDERAVAAWSAYAELGNEALELLVAGPVPGPTHEREDWEDELKEQPLDLDPPVGPPPPPLVPAGWYRRKPRRGSDSARSRAIDAKLEQLGVRGRR